MALTDLIGLSFVEKYFNMHIYTEYAITENNIKMGNVNCV